LDENIAHCAAVTVAELKGLAAMELVPSTVLKGEYIALQATIYQQYQSELAPDPGNETSLLDVLEAFLVSNSASIIGEITAGAISAATRSSLLDQFATSGQRGHDPANLNSPTVNKDRHNALTVMSSAQAYLECKVVHFSIGRNYLILFDSGVKAFRRRRSQLHRPRLSATIGHPCAQSTPRFARQHFS
jgi:hypothetical protein